MLLEGEPLPELSILNRNPSLLDGPRLLHELIRSSSYTSAPAIDFLEHGSKRRILTYEELHASSEALARKIHRSLEGLENPSSIVPVLLPQSPELYIALLAILKAGRAFCPIGLDTPKERLDFILHDLPADLLITDSKQEEKLPQSNIRVLLVDTELLDYVKVRDDEPLPTNNKAHLAYVLYTSGSTGLPKAVSVSHYAVTQSLLAHDRHIPCFSRFLQFAAPTFDVSIFEIFFPLYRGCTLVSCTRTDMLNDLPGIIGSMEVDAAELTPTVVSNLLRGRSSVPGLKLLLTIGEMLTGRVVEDFGGPTPEESILWGMYGPTEAAIHCTLQTRFTTTQPVGTIGVPLDTVSAFIAAPLDKGNEDVSITILPMGEVGELVVGGPQVAEEYLNRPELTKAAFINDTEFGYLYRTGDKARLNRNGTLECLGRIVSGQVKLRGQRVELGEVEKAALKTDDCYSATVMVIEELLVAFCAFDSGNAPVNAIRDTCRRWLPSHMVPSEILILQSIPQLASGKIDKKALEAEFWRSRHENSTALINTTKAYRSGIHSPITTILSKTLGRDVGTDLNLGLAGIDSLRSIVIASALREGGYNVTAVDILSATTSTQLIDLCDLRRGSQNSAISHSSRLSVYDFPELRHLQSELQDVFPCTPLQEAMLVETETRPSAYCNWIEVEIHTPQTFTQIRHHLLELARQNQILRSGFFYTSSASASFYQVVWKSLAPSTFQEVTFFSRNYTLGSAESLLRPFSAQIIANSQQTRILFQIHHALYDGWSFDLLIHDLNKSMSGETPKSRPQFQSVVNYHLGLREDDRAETKAYWSEKLQSYCPKPLPNFNGRRVDSDGLQRMQGRSCVDAQCLYASARTLSMNPQVFFQAATAYMISLYTSSSDVVIGSVTSGRTIPVTRIEDVVGPCIASLPFRIDFSEHATVLDLLKTIQKVNREMLQHCTLPLRDITKACKMSPGERLFEVLFVWQQSLISNFGEGRQLHVVDSADDSEFKITLEFEPHDDYISYKITYDPASMPEQQIRYLATQIDCVASHFLANIEGKLDKVVGSFSKDSASIANPGPQQAPIVHGPSRVVEEWAIKTPDNDAVVFGAIVDGVMQVREKFTFASLNVRANRLAHALVERGVGNDELVSIVLEKSVDFYVSTLAVLKAGCGYLPITPDTPVERTKRILEDAEVSICISHSSVCDELRVDTLTILELDKLDLSDCSDQNLDVPYNGSHLAYAVFTSGSTGQPKGVLVTQENLMSNLEYLSSLYPTSSDSRLLQSCSQSFDVSVFEIFFSWHVGMPLCTATKDDLFHDFEAAIDSLEITHLSLTPTVAGLVDPKQVPKVKFLVTAGEALTENVRRKWAGKGLFQGYGPSETTNICTVRPYVTSVDLINNIGKPFPNTSAIVLEPGHNHIVPRGAVGELCFGGFQVFRGYLKRPELNAEKIIDHPQFGRIYRSGDMGLLLPDDSILSTGRIDDQVKIRGQRVELGEITTILLDHPPVIDCATLLLQHDGNSQGLVCFWVPKQSPGFEFQVLSPLEHRSTTAELFETLALKLPSYMIPSHLIPISCIPMTAQAKVDKRILRAKFETLSPELLQSMTSSQEVENGKEELSSSERMIIEVLARTLDTDVERIVSTSSFFNLGIDSISAIRFGQGLRHAGFERINVSTILKNPSVKRLASALAKNSTQISPAKKREPSVVDIFDSEWILRIRSEFSNRGQEVEKVLPCTPLQEAMLSSVSSETSSYQNMMVFKVNGQLDRLKRAWNHMFVRHEILRTAFVANDTAKYAFAQVILSPADVYWEEIASSDNITSCFEKILPTLMKKHLPPVRMGIQRSDHRTSLVFSCHHALYDGTAISVLLEEVQDLYLGKELPPIVPYEGYLQCMIDQDLEAADNFWLEHLSEFEPTAFPNISSRMPASEQKAHSYERSLQLSLQDTLEFCQSSSTSLLSLVQASWAKILHFCTGESDVCFGNVVSGRSISEEDLDRLVAPCFNTLPVRVNFDFKRPSLELCKRLHRFNIEVLPFQLTPLRRIQSRVLRDHRRLFDSLVILQQPTSLPDQSIWKLECDTGEMDLPVVCEVFQDQENNKLRLTLHYNDSLISNADVEVLSELYEKTLQSLIRCPDSPANDTLQYPSTLLGQSNMNWSSFAPLQGKLLHSAFEANAIERPEALAVDFLHGDGRSTAMSFRDLNERANQLAHALVQEGIMTENIVPVHMLKSPEFYVSILGVLKAGAAFAPIHPGLPEERKRFMISEIQPKLMISNGNADWAGTVPIFQVANLTDFPRTNPIIPDLQPTNLAYCLYTSGSTGVPKAVSMEHRAPIQTVESSRSLVPWCKESRLLQYAAVTFDMCYYDCFVAWSFGFTLCSADQDAMLNNLPDTINTLDVDLLDLTPSVASLLRRADIPSVKWLYCIGEAMTSEVVKEWATACANSFGPTEGAFCTTIFPVDEDLKTSVIGKPFETTSFAVFPPNGDRPLPILSIGELYIGGAQLARGYLNNAELNDEKFVQRCGQRFYKSGDMVRMLSDGNFEFLGRTDDQVKIRGLRVELGEINHAVQDCDARIAVASSQIMRREEDAKNQLVCFLVTNALVSEAEQTEMRQRARQAAKDHLPVYMVPQFFIFVDAIPKSLAGKVDRKALLQIFNDSEELRSAAHETDASTTHEWTKNELVIRDILSKLSGAEATFITPWTTIYQIGLDSISAVQVASALRKRNLPITAGDVMRYANCKELAAHIEKTHNTGREGVKLFDFAAFEEKHRVEVVATTDLSSENIEAILPCTPLQCGMLSQFLAREGEVYFNHLRLRLNSDVDVQQMKEAWSIVARKHPILRTGFVHVKHNKMPFAMIQYRKGAVNVSWLDGIKSANDTVDQWLESSRNEVMRQLHRPTWCARLVEDAGEVYLDLALLHAIFDAQSLRLIFDDVGNAYRNKSFGQAKSLQPILNNILQSSTDNNSRNFWQQLGRIAAPTRFPNVSPLKYDAAPPATVTRSSSSSSVDLDMACRRGNITLQAAALTSWAALLASYTGEASVTFGVVLAGRNFEGADKAVFPCITTVPFVCKITDEKENVLREVMELNADLQQHQFTPLNEAQKLMGFPNEQIFDSIFAYQKLSNADLGRHPWTIVDEKAEVEYPISIEIEPKEDVLEYRLTFLPHLVPKEQATLILDQFDHILQYYVSPDTAAVNEYTPNIYSITPAKEPILPSKARLLHDMVELTAAKFPHRIALEFATSLCDGEYESRKWTYRELDAIGNQIAHILLFHGVVTGELVGVCFDKCPEASFAMLGILKAGCAFVALDPGAPNARKAFIIQDAHLKVVLSTKTQSMDMKGNAETTVLNLDGIDLQLMSSDKPVLARDIDPQDLSYCLYTSGTTGTPKGCEITHENAIQAMLSFQRLFAGHWEADSRWLQFASFHFDVSVLEQYWSWYVGICVVSAPRDLIFEDLAASIKTLSITHIDLTPSLARILHPDDVPSLCKGVFITGGESLKQEILDVWGPKGVIYNGYGPTECTIGCTMYARVPANGKPSNIGPQFDNVGSYVLKPKSDLPVLRGGVGELCVSGKLVGRGYLNRPDLTETAFPHLARFDKQVYRTGDLVRILHNGDFEFLGRADDQVKLRGQRLEIGEINAVIKQSGIAIADIATLVVKHPKQQKEQLVSFVVLEASVRGQAEIVVGKSNELNAAKQACQDKLPPYMVPTHFVALTSLPLNSNNKADARQLKEMYGDLSASDLQTFSSDSQAKDGNWTKYEEKIRDTLKEVLNIEDDMFSKDASLFEMGMDSISVIGVSRALKQVGFSQATASVVMNNASVRRLGKVLPDKSSLSKERGSITAAQQAITAIEHRHRRSVAEALFMDARNIEALAPCTPLQQGMIARSLDSDNGLYFNTFCFELTDEVNLDRLYDAWETTFKSTQILRTVFVNTEDGYVQAALRRASLTFSHVDLDNSDNVENSLEKLRLDWVKRNLSMIKTPLEIHSIQETKRKLMVVHIFHAVYDGISIEHLFRQIWETYNSRNPQPGPQFQSTLAYGPLRDMEGSREFWKSHLFHNTFSPLPTAHGSPTGASVCVSRTISDLNNLESTRRSLNVTAQAISQACWIQTLHRHIKNTVTLGIVVSGRGIDFDGAETVNGPLFNTLPFQYRPRRRESWTSIIRQTHDFNVVAHPFQHTPLRDIMKWCRRSPDQPLFDTLFVYQVMTGDADWMKNNAWELRSGSAEADYPLAIEIEQHGEELCVNLVVQGHVLDEMMALKLIDRFEESLRQALSEPASVVETYPADEAATTESEVKTSTNTSARGTEFKWTANASAIREEMANLAETESQDISETTSIFELGLDSIDAIKLSSKLKKRGFDLAVSGIMRSANIANMLQHVTAGKKKHNERPSDMFYQSHKRRLESHLKHKGATDGYEKILPLTPLQEAMVAEMIASDYTRYFNHDVLKLATEVDVERMRDAWEEVVKNSPILRTSFVHIDDPGIDSSFAQVIHCKAHQFLERLEVQQEPDFPALFEAARQRAIEQSFTQPLFHIQLVQAPAETYLVLSIPHALYDGWSLGLLHQDVRQTYSGRSKSRPNYEPVLAKILTTSGADAVAFWRDYLSGATLSTFPRKKEHIEERTQAVHRKEQTSPVSLDGIAAFAKKNNITLQTLGQTVYSLALASLTHSLDVAFGSVLSGRDDDERSALLFPVMNTVAIRTILHGTRKEMLQYVQENFSNMKQWQHFPLRKALSLAGIRGPLFESLFIYQKKHGSEKVDKKPYESIEGQSNVEYPVCVEMEIVDDQLVWRCAVKDEVFDENGTRELVERLDLILASIMENPNAPTIDFKADGTSVCGLLVFDDTNNREDNIDNLEEGRNTGPRFSLTTAKTIREVLSIVSKIPEDEITQDITIFHIGLDSISAIKVSSLLRKRGITLSVGEMLKAGTVEKMAMVLHDRSLGKASTEADIDKILADSLAGVDRETLLKKVGVDEKDVERLMTATPGQTYMLSMWSNSAGALFYPEFRYELRGSSLFDTVQNAWKDLIAAYPILRTCFYATGNECTPYVQVVLRETERTVYDVTGWSEKEVGEILRHCDMKQPYVYLLAARTDDKWDLTLKIHHGLYDGVSLPILVRELQNLCNGTEATRQPDNSFTNLIANSFLSSPIRDRESYWKNYLHGVQTQQPSQPQFTPTSKVEIFRPGLVHKARQLESFARRNGITTQSVFLAIFARIYARKIPDSHDIVIGIYLANRSHSIPGLAEAALPTVNLVPLRISAPLQTPLVESAAQIQKDIQEISSNMNVSVALWEIERWCDVKIDCWVNFLKLPDTEDGATKSAEHENVTITPQNLWGKEVQRSVKLNIAEFQMPGEVFCERVQSAYLHSIDVEATIRDNSLDVGVFAPEEMLSLEDGKKLVEDIADEFRLQLEGTE